MSTRSPGSRNVGSRPDLLLVCVGNASLLLGMHGSGLFDVVSPGLEECDTPQ